MLKVMTAAQLEAFNMPGVRSLHMYGQIILFLSRMGHL